MKNIKIFEVLRDNLREAKQDLMNHLADNYIDIDYDSRLIIVGEIRALSSVIAQLRGIIKWGDVE
jgi:hypothetical protein